MVCIKPMKRSTILEAAACIVAIGLAALTGCGPKPEPVPEAPPEEEIVTIERTLEVARAYMDEGRVGEAADLYERVMEEDSRSFEANLNLGIALMTMEDARHENERDYARVREHFRTARDVRDDVPGPHFYLGMVEFKEKKYSQAIESLEVAARLDPGNESAHEMLGISLVAYGSEERGKGHLERTLKINPDNAVANLELGKIYEKEGRYESAGMHLERALAANPNLDLATYLLQRIYYNLGSYDRAEEMCMRFLRHYPDDIQSLETLGNIYRSQDRTDEMLEVYEKLTGIRPDNTTYWSPLVHHYMEQEDYERARDVLEDALEENPYYAYGNIRYGQVLLHYGDESLDDGDTMRALNLYGQAKLHFEKAKVDDRYVSAAFQLIDQANGRIDKASSR